MKKLYILAGIVLIFGMLGCANSDEGQSKESNAEPASVTEVTVAHVKSGPIYKAYIDVGSILPEDYARIMAKVAGRIASISVDEGSPVKKGQLLMQIDTFDYTRAVENASALKDAAYVSFKKASRDFKRMEQLHKSKAISEQKYQDAKTGLDLARYQYEQAKVAFSIARRALKECKVISPISGIVTNKYVNEGELTGPQQVAFVIMQLDKVKVEVDLPEEAFSYITEGNKGYVEVDAIPDEVFEGTITKIYPTIDPASRTFKITISLDNPELKLRSGMTARVKVVEQAKANTIMAPKTSLIRGEKGYYVFKVVSNRIEKIKVHTGIEGTDAIEILDGISPGDVVVTKGVTGLKDGMQVKVTATDKQDQG